MIRSHTMVIVLALTACHCESTSPRPATRQPAPPITQTMRDQMHMAEHLQSARALQQAIAHGRLRDARELAAWFASHPMREQAPFQKHVMAMRGAALRIHDAQDVATAGGELGRLGTACASCHLEAGVTPTFTYGGPPREMEDSLEAQMERHEWAAIRLWEGVIGPSEREWSEGATVLAVDSVDVSKMTHEKPNADVVSLAERLQQQARQALTLDDPGERARFYGEMMTTCASCHQIVRPHPIAHAHE
jgi:cytochrome c556